MRQEELILDYMYKNSGFSYTTKRLHEKLNIPHATVRKFINEYKKQGVIKINKIPQHKKSPEYYTNEIILKKWVDSLKKEKRKLQIAIAQKKRRMKNRFNITDERKCDD